MNYPAIDTELLRTFVAIADYGGFTRAAEMVNRTQSAVSMQMKRLEEDVLQRAVFERDGRQVRLTAEGQILLGYARRILKLHGEVMNTLRQPHMVGSVRIAVAWIHATLCPADSRAAAVSASPITMAHAPSEDGHVSS